MEEEEAHTETLICFFRYSPYFPSPFLLLLARPANDRRAAFFRRSLSSATTFRLLPTSLFHLLFSCARRASPRPRLQLRRPAAFQPLEQQFIFIAMFWPLHLFAPHHSSRRLTTARVQEKVSFYPYFALARSFISSFFLSARRSLALPVVSNFAKGWQRECAPRPSRNGAVFFLPPPSLFPSASSSFFCYLLFRFFSRPFLLLLAAVSRDREKY